MPSVSTCGELAAYLASQPRDRKVVMAKDAEENGFSPLAEAREGLYLAESTWSGEVYMTPEEYAAEAAKAGSGYAEEDGPPTEEEGAERVVVLGPVN